jgi:hypothetical protein
MILVRALSKGSRQREDATVRNLLTLLIGCLTVSTMLFVALTLRSKSSQMTEVTAQRISEAAEMRNQIGRMQTLVAHLAEQVDSLQPSICQSFGHNINDNLPVVTVTPPHQLNDADCTPEWDTPSSR